MVDTFKAQIGKNIHILKPITTPKTAPVEVQPVDRRQLVRFQLSIDDKVRLRLGRGTA